MSDEKTVQEIRVQGWVEAERVRQRRQWESDAGDHDQRHSPSEWTMILAHLLGDVAAQSMHCQPWHGRDGQASQAGMAHPDLLYDVVQLAAAASAYVESRLALDPELAAGVDALIALRYKVWQPTEPTPEPDYDAAPAPAPDVQP